jgi:thermitase
MGLFSLLALLSALVTPVPLFAEPVTDSVSEGWIVKYKTKEAFTTASTLHRRTGGRVIERNEQLGFEVVQFTSDLAADRITAYKASPLVEYVEPNHTVHALWTPNDPDFPTKQWGPQKIQAPRAWDVTRSNSAIKIAIIDTGVESTHPDLSGKIAGGWDFVDDDATPQDGNGHGTHVAGLAAAATNNGIGMAAVAPDARILAVRVLDNNGSGTIADVASGIQYAADQGAKVINLSLGSSSSSTTLQNAVNYAWSKGAVLVASAGGSGSTTPTYPAAYSNVIAVACTTASDTLCSFSNRGTWVDVAAPGQSIYSTYKGGGFAYLSGTSMAAAHVSGVAGLLAAQNRTNANIVEAIVNTADPLSGSTFGRVNAYKAVTY